MHILGISAYYHDAAACLVRDGEIVAAAQEERFTRKKHDSAFPVHAIAYCLAEAGIDPHQVDHVVFYDKPFLKFERLFETYLAFAPRGFRSFATSLPVWLKDKLFQKSMIAKALAALWGDDVDWNARLLFSEHHELDEIQQSTFAAAIGSGDEREACDIDELTIAIPVHREDAAEGDARVHVGTSCSASRAG